MKSKNLLMAAGAFLFAMGGAVAYTVAPTNIWVKAKLQNGGATTCVDTKKQCESTGTDICTVQVPIIGGGTQTASSSGPKFTFRSDCETLLFNNNDTPLVSTIDPVFEVVAGR